MTRITTAAATVLAALLLAQTAAAQEIVPPAELEPVDCTFQDGQIPDNMIMVICPELRLLGGQAKFGSVASDVEGPIVLRQQPIAVQSNSELVPVEEEGNGGGGLAFPEIGVPGGLLGAAGLADLGEALLPVDELLEPALGPVLGVKAAIEPVGELTSTEPDIDAFWAGEGLLTTASLPLRVRVRNVALGDRCFIGSQANPIALNLDANVSEGYRFAGSPDQIPNIGGPIPVQTVWAQLAVGDEEFAVPGASGCGVAGLGGLLRNLGGTNPFDDLINDAVGLPSPSGENLLALDGWFGVKFCLRHPSQSCLWPLEPTNAPLDFGEVAVGQSSAPQELVFENITDEPRTLSGETVIGGPSQWVDLWEITADGCQGATLEPGDSCAIEIVFTPQDVGLRFNDIHVFGDGPGSLGEARVRGRGIEP